MERRERWRKAFLPKEARGKCACTGMGMPRRNIQRVKKTPTGGRADKKTKASRGAVDGLLDNIRVPISDVAAAYSRGSSTSSSTSSSQSTTSDHVGMGSINQASNDLLGREEGTGQSRKSSGSGRALLWDDGAPDVAVSKLGPTSDEKFASFEAFAAPPGSLENVEEDLIPSPVHTSVTEAPAHSQTAERQQMREQLYTAASELEKSHDGANSENNAEELGVTTDMQEVGVSDDVNVAGEEEREQDVVEAALTAVANAVEGEKEEEGPESDVKEEEDNEENENENENEEEEEEEKEEEEAEGGTDKEPGDVLEDPVPTTDEAPKRYPWEFDD
uniref:Uncharacterized protein n=1 Tax=Trypanosoma vivax (strain Y486) TaxID=1055687 RepID=G0UD68_TRYVY|nr:hypothetical protein TVY486_1112630 [Trypanosoma vivax Y486]